MLNELAISGVPGGRSIEPLCLNRFAPAVASSTGYNAVRAMPRLARASSMRATAIFKSRLLASASSTSLVSCSSPNSVQKFSAPGAACSVIGGSSTSGLEVSTCAHAATNSAAQTSKGRNFTAISNVLDSLPRRRGAEAGFGEAQLRPAGAGRACQRATLVTAGAEIGRAFISASIVRAPTRGNLLDSSPVHFGAAPFALFHLRAQLVSRAHFTQLAVGDRAEEQRHEKNGEERCRQHSAHDAGSSRDPCARTCAAGERKWNHAEDEGQRRHDDRPESQTRGLDRSRGGGIPLRLLE